jgi:hypothetical protein
METFKGAGCDSRLLSFALRNGLIITSGRGGQHNVGSKHYRGLAIDVSVRHNRAGAPLTEDFISHLKRDCAAHGLLLRDERTRPPGQKVWAGPHLHCEVI